MMYYKVAPTFKKKNQGNKQPLHTKKVVHFNGNTFMFLLNKILNTAGVTVSPCMYIQSSAADLVQRTCMLQSLSKATALASFKTPSWVLINHSDVIRHISSLAV